MNYRNQDIIDSVEKVSKEILAESRHNRHRDYFFPMLIDRMNYKKAVEIGVDKGEFSLHLLSKSNLDKLYCIDSWLDNFGSDYKPDFYDKNGNNRMAETKRNLELYVINERVELIKSNSFDASVKFQSDELDFVYIDGDHSLEGIFVDLYSWFPKVKKGGVWPFTISKMDRNRESPIGLVISFLITFKLLLNIFVSDMV